MKSNKIKTEYEGTFRGASKSFGFVKLLDNDNEVYISDRDSMNAMDGDRVVVKILKPAFTEDKNAEGKIVKIIERKDDKVIGIFTPYKNFAFVTPINKKISFDVHIDRKFFGKAVKDSIVVCKILAKNGGANPEGVITEVIGHKDDPNATLTAIIRGFKIKDTFDDDTIAESNVVAIDINENEYRERVDLRDKTFITIDGEDTKDIDDAIFLERLDNGNVKLYVSIADVSHYVKENGAIDREAQVRGNSVYLLDRVIPMIPHVLSNGMCSLNESEDRLTLTCEMEYDENVKLINYSIYKSVINSHMRCTYNEVQNYFDGKEVLDIDKNIKLMLTDMLMLSRKLRKEREKRGAINFNLKETVIDVDENLNPVAIREKERIEAYELIEDFMVAANETVATTFYKKKVPFLYRVHETCDSEKIKALLVTLGNLGVSFRYSESIKPKEIQKLLNSVKNKPYEDVVARLTLRSMSQARYSKKCIGHFALASKYYTHFTSPIRRYNDLMIHRIIKEVMDEKYTEKRKQHYEKILDDIALNISKTERTAIDCERDVEALKKCEFMSEYIGDVFEGAISGFTNYGMFVELPNTVEGMIAYRDMKDDHYEFETEKYQVIGERSHKIFTFGQKVKVKLVRVLPELRAIDFILYE